MAKRVLVEETVREDGLRVITKRLPYIKEARIAIVCLAGSAFDPEGKSGLFHYFEHMAFKGTETRTMEELAELFERFAFQRNAYTAKLQTCYWTHGAARRVPQMAETLFDIYQHPSFPEEELEKEKLVVLAEVARNEDTDDWVAYWKMCEALWEENPLRQYGTGVKDELKTVTRNDLIETHTTWYVPSNTAVVMVGPVPHNEIVAQAFEAIAVNDRTVSYPEWDNEYGRLPTTQEIVVPVPKRNKSTIRIGCKVPQLTQREEITLNLLTRMLGSGSNNILQREIRNKRGLAYAVGGGFYRSVPLGNFATFSGEALPENTREVIDLIRSVVLDYPLTDLNHFFGVKEKLFDIMYVSLTGCGEWFNNITSEMLSNRRDAEGYSARLKSAQRILSAIQLEDVLELRERFFQPEQFVTVVVQPE